MAHFFIADSATRINTLYISSSGEARVGLALGGALSIRSSGGTGSPNVVVVQGRGFARQGPRTPSSPRETMWDLSGLDETSVIRGFRDSTPVTDELPVKHFLRLPASRSISRQLARVGIGIDLDQEIERVISASEVVGEGVEFYPTNFERLADALSRNNHFHHDDRGNIFGRLAASATKGEGYREINTPSLHFAVSPNLCSVHLDSYAFMVRGPNGDYIIAPDAGQHIFDELLFRMPMPWLRNNAPFAAAVLSRLHPVLPNSTNNFAFRFGLRLTLGGSGNLDYKTGMPLLTFESTIGPLSDKNRWNHSAQLRLLNVGNPDRTPDLTLTVRAEAACSDLLCRNDSAKTIGLLLKGTVP
jgi:hypothetical protein